jgi:hypothetical protein
MALTKSFAIATGEAASDTTITTGTFSSVGFTHLVALAKHEGAAATITLSDNKSTSVFNPLTKESHASGVSGQLIWAKIGSPGTGHTVTMTLSAARDFKGVAVWLVNASTSGDIELDAEAHAQGTGPNMDAGSLVTTGVSVVSFMGIAEGNSANWTNGAGWATDFTGMSGVLATFGQSRGAETTSPIDPVATADASIPWCALAASFREAAAGAAGFAVPRNISTIAAVNRAANF